MRYFSPLLLIVFVFSFSSCFKNNENGCEAVAPETEAGKMKYFCDTAGIKYSQLPNGLFYEIMTAGSGASPSLESRVTVTYTGALLTGYVFDKSTAPVTFNLNGLIGGWKAGLPLIKKGGRIKLVIPSYLGYGCTAMPGLPANSVLYFDISLTDVQ
ncbi:FKBP-type peptidyl-prolyl cis-trans isomerase [Filimonas effusa]|nr:FKBP-type peptidyl-prolyl cis-trans isomerase [Filimonas effusa]